MYRFIYELLVHGGLVVAYWMKDVLRDLEQFCEANSLVKIQSSVGDAQRVLDEEIQLREEKQMISDPQSRDTGL